MVFSIHETVRLIRKLAAFLKALLIRSDNSDMTTWSNHSMQRMRWFTLISVLFLGGCGRPDVILHSKPTQAELSVAEANWEQLERAFVAKDFNSARSLVGRPIVFQAQFHRSNTGPFAFATRYRVAFPAEEGMPFEPWAFRLRSWTKEGNPFEPWAFRLRSWTEDGMPPSILDQNFERASQRLESLPRIPWRWKLIPLQERTLGHDPFADSIIYGSLQAVDRKGIEVDLQDVETMSLGF
jgi:hypothetical protein